MVSPPQLEKIGAGQVRPHGQKRGYRQRQQAKKIQAAISRATIRGCNYRPDFRVLRIIAAWCIMVYHSEHVYGVSFGYIMEPTI